MANISYLIICPSKPLTGCGDFNSLDQIPICGLPDDFQAAVVIGVDGSVFSGPNVYRVPLVTGDTVVMIVGNSIGGNRLYRLNLNISGFKVIPWIDEPRSTISSALNGYSGCDNLFVIDPCGSVNIAPDLDQELDIDSCVVIGSRRFRNKRSNVNRYA